MSVHDFIAAQDEAKAHEHMFLLWPKLWQEYTKNHGFTFNWDECQFLDC